jgi:hypothetical protein
MENKNEMSKEMKRYYKNKERYNERAKNYFKEVYYPKHKPELLQKSKERRLLNNNLYVCKYKSEKTKNIYYSLNNSLVVSFD